MKHSRVKTIATALALALLVATTPGTSPALGRSDTTRIVLNGNAIAVEGGGVTVDGSTATITAAGSYDLSGTLAEGRIVVDTDDDGAVTLIFAGADITSASAAPIAITNADEVVIVLADGTAISRHRRGEFRLGHCRNGCAQRGDLQRSRPDDPGRGIAHRDQQRQ